ncbi:MAG: 6-phosphogluconolactonase, partial [Rhodobacteraceae bacterium]
MRMMEYPDQDLLAMDVANRLAGDLKNALLRHDHVSFAVPGGTTPGPIFDALCGADLDWDRVHVLPTDERWVPQEDPRSNAGMIARRLLTDRASAARLLPLYAPAADPSDVLPEVTAELVPEMPISVLVMGM